MSKKRRDTESMNLSFLDVITCGFGGIILLLVITKMFEPIRLEESHTELEGLITRYQEELNDILGETDVVQRERLMTAENVEQDEIQIAQLQEELVRIRAAVLASEDDASVSSELAGQLAQAKQRLTEEMQRLLTDYRPDPDEYMVGGIPVDSEYIIFIIDTSGSMQRYAWDRVRRQISETLAVYPQVRGIQVMNDMGEYMFKSYRNEWIPDTPGRREAINDALSSWNAFSNSSPREGILAAIEAFYDPTKKISLYVYSDDFSAGSINAVVREVDRRNLAGADGTRRVRIHAVAFPVYYEVANGELLSSARFAILMRELCQRNGGTFVALPSLRR
ncbi:MAG: VWA domain-containing protein [Gammaproteobacteria bacterium]|nr:VWA domain-containing protein [Gammaproteobacteria bacterium]MDH3506923.1 VWA domain-containing protein [Gammaproteobacteria bacterium]